MDEITRLEYLKIMGVERWSDRTMIEPNTATIKPNPMENKPIIDHWESLKEEVIGCQQCELC
ncbi:MAG: hypothetical protein KAG10_00085, partial [Methylococcales bacterium]|nr:hypothetical protein [Methylococcales bacterium]